jgi:hypothetical protein
MRVITVIPRKKVKRRKNKEENFNASLHLTFYIFSPLKRPTHYLDTIQIVWHYEKFSHLLGSPNISVKSWDSYFNFASASHYPYIIGSQKGCGGVLTALYSPYGHA